MGNVGVCVCMCCRVPVGVNIASCTAHVFCVVSMYHAVAVVECWHYTLSCLSLSMFLNAIGVVVVSFGDNRFSTDRFGIMFGFGNHVCGAICNTIVGVL